MLIKFQCTGGFETFSLEVML